MSVRAIHSFVNVEVIVTLTWITQIVVLGVSAQTPLL